MDRSVVFHDRMVVYPEEFEACTVPVLQGEYVVPDLPDEPRGALRVLDCGAGVGAFSLFARRRFEYSQLTITCVEPDPMLAGYVRRNVPEATVIEAAVSAGEGGADLYRGPNGHYGYNTIDARTGNPHGPLTVSVKRVHPRDLPPCDVLKLDIEGPELEALQHYPHLAGVWWVVLEWHIEHERRACEQILVDSGLRAVWGRWLDAAAGLQTWARTRARVNRGAWRYEL
jgi:FkbM family methyltransferase